MFAWLLIFYDLTSLVLIGLDQPRSLIEPAYNLPPFIAYMMSAVRKKHELRAATVVELVYFRKLRISILFSPILSIF